RDFHVTGVQTCALPIFIWLAGPEMGSAGVTRRPRTGRWHERARTGHRHGRGLHDGEGRGDRSREQGDLVARLPAPSHQAAREMTDRKSVVEGENFNTAR